MTKKRSRGRNKSILDYVSQVSGLVDRSNGSPSSETSAQESIDSIIKELVAERKKFETTPVESRDSKDSVCETLESSSKPSIPTGEVVDDILEKGLGSEDVVCSSDGKCIDGLNIGEVFTDKYGFKRKRGFVNTTRLPIYLDWIVEEGIVREIMHKTYVLETNLGSRAIIPEDYLCEFQFRYGIVIKNYDKCIGYKSILVKGDIDKKKK